MKHLFIVNPTAGKKDSTQSVRERVEKAFADRDDSYEIFVTSRAMEAPGKIKAEAESGEHIRVYACGGDGTFNECVCGAAGLSNVAVCPFPTGTGNDFCRMFGDEKDKYRDLEAILNGYETEIDLINCNGRYSANICSAGIDARIGVDVHKYSSLPMVGGMGAYVLSTIVNVFKGINSKMRVRCDDHISDGKHALVCVCNGRFYGGGFNPSLYARPDDGLLDIFIVTKVNIFQLPFLIGKYSTGRADELPKFVTHLRTDNIDIEFEEENVVQADGEAIVSKQISMRLEPKALKLVVPLGMHFFDKKESCIAAK